MNLCAVFWLACCLSLVYTQCDENSCTRECFPALSDRDLCTFYQQVSQWSESAAECGLSIPPLPQSRPGLVTEGMSSEEQWRIASDYWLEITGLWQARFGTGEQNPLIPDETPPSTMEPLPQTTPPEETTDFLTPDDFFSGSGSGDDITTTLETVTIGTTTMATEGEPTTMTDAPVMRDNAEIWSDANEIWETNFRQWVESAQEGVGLQLPSNLDVSEVIDGYGQDERANRGAWSQLAGFWRENLNVYDDSYGGMCPEQ